MMAPEIVPAETLQAEVEHVQPPRIIISLWVAAAVLVAAHIIWVSHGTPVPAFLLPVLEMLNV